MHRFQLGTIAAVLVFCGHGLTHAASLAYPGPIAVQDGSYDSIVETSTTDTPPLYGAPAAGAGNVLTFDMPGFTATAGPDSADLTVGALELTFDADPGMFIDTVSIFESGTFAVTGDASVSVAGALTVRYLDEMTGLIVTLADPILTVVTPAGSFPVVGTQLGDWFGAALIDMAAMGIETSQVIIAMDNNLAAGAPIGGSASISKDTLTVNVTTVPEPASLALIAAGTLLIVWRHD